MLVSRDNFDSFEEEAEARYERAEYQRLHDREHEDDWREAPFVPVAEALGQLPATLTRRAKMAEQE
jgi:hypothetical protein